MAKNYYWILGVSRSATAREIKQAYRKLAMKYHPDRNKDNPDAAARFIETQEAYDVLKDGPPAPPSPPETPRPAPGSNPSPQGPPGKPSDEEDNFSRYFGDLFGGL